MQAQLAALAAAVVLAGPAAAPPPAGPAAKLPAPGPAPAPAAPRQSTTCVQDDPVPTPPDWRGWDRSAVIAWEAVEQGGGVVPDIEEDRTQSPPGWWRYPSPMRSQALLEAEARNAASGLYQAVAPAEIAKGDILVRTRGAGLCGKMAVIDREVERRWVTIEVDPDGRKSSTRPGSPLFFARDGRTLLPEARAFRIRVKKEATIGQLRELGRDLAHLERTIGDRPLFLAKGGREVVDEKVHDLVDEAWSLVAEVSFDVDRREMTGRALAIGAQLEWPGAAAAATAVLDDVLRRAPGRADAATARASLALLAGEPERALALARGARTQAPAPLRAPWVEARALLALGRAAEARGALDRFLEGDPLDVRARRLAGELGAGTPASALPSAPPLAPARADGGAAGDGVRYVATPDQGGLDAPDLGIKARWPISWRVLAVTGGLDGALAANLATGRVLLDDGSADRATATLLAQRAPGAGARAALLKEGARKVFAGAKLKTLPPLLPGSRRQQWSESQMGAARTGEVTTLVRGDVVYTLVLNASVATYPKLRDEFAVFVRSLGAEPSPPPSPPSPPSPSSPPPSR